MRTRMQPFKMCKEMMENLLLYVLLLTGLVSEELATRIG